jgi:hypothetical protein
MDRKNCWDELLSIWDKSITQKKKKKKREKEKENKENSTAAFKV